MGLNFLVIALFGIAVFILAGMLSGYSVNKGPKPYKKNIFKKYEAKPSIMNEAEKRLHQALNRRFGDSHIIAPMIRCEDVIFVKPSVRNYKERMSLRGRIKSRHFDFALCKLDGQPVLLIELDGKTHKRKAQKKADKFKNDLVAAVGLQLLRIEASENYYNAVKSIKL